MDLIIMKIQELTTSQAGKIYKEFWTCLNSCLIDQIYGNDA